MPTTSHEVTQLLMDWGNGDPAALDRLMPLVYGELRQMARRYMSRQNPGHTLQTTALINEAFVKLVGQPDKQFQNRAHFFGVAAQAMRSILVDYARMRDSQKRGGAISVIALEDTPKQGADIAQMRSADLIALDDALNLLVTLNPRHSQIVELRFFGGLTEVEIAEVLQVSERTVRSDWRVARAWLQRELSRQ